jgi:hypothetical protein
MKSLNLLRWMRSRRYEWGSQDHDRRDPHGSEGLAEHRGDPDENVGQQPARRSLSRAASRPGIADRETKREHRRERPMEALMATLSDQSPNGHANAATEVAHRAAKEGLRMARRVLPLPSIGVLSSKPAPNRRSPVFVVILLSACLAGTGCAFTHSSVRAYGGAPLPQDRVALLIGGQEGAGYTLFEKWRDANGSFEAPYPRTGRGVERSDMPSLIEVQPGPITVCVYFDGWLRDRMVGEHATGTFYSVGCIGASFEARAGYFYLFSGEMTDGNRWSLHVTEFAIADLTKLACADSRTDVHNPPATRAQWLCPDEVLRQRVTDYFNGPRTIFTRQSAP